MNEVERREYLRIKKAESRARQKALSTPTVDTPVDKDPDYWNPDGSLRLYQYRCTKCGGLWGASAFTLNKCPYCKTLDTSEKI